MFTDHQQTAVKEAAPRVVFDISPIMAKLRSVLSEYIPFLFQFKPDENLPDEPLQRMNLALLRHRKTQLSESELQVKCSATHEVAMLKNSWMIWQRFERITMSIELFGWRAVNEKLLAISDEKAIIIDSVKFDFSSLTDHDPSYIRRSVSSKTQSIAEIYREHISDNLHDYYTVTMKTPNYAGRLIRIMSIVHCIENIHYERSKVMELARIFDIFKIEASEKGMFDC
ncbi:unnamed protein product [Angiostrongylus costaricensis]|uniref:NR LBD domain-containing protein n=1 Tax=Angiostrongylus costaricensis TaxID=334426 RepID=A0A0R3PK52_ANGCS|nr:unnamed protein product [Angiostrongylus costaricensis]